MKIQVSLKMTIADLQRAFSSYFPYLSLSFFTKPRSVYQSAPVKYCITENTLFLERIESQPHDADIDIRSDMTVSELEQLFEQEFGLHVQVLCRNKNFYAAAACLDHLSLHIQNDKARQAEETDPCFSQPIEYYDARTEWYLG